MLLANEVVCVGVFLLMGCGGFGLLALSVLGKLARGAWRMMVGAEDRPSGEGAGGPGSIRCGNPGCGELNRRGRFCRRCGVPLPVADNVDRYG